MQRILLIILMLISFSLYAAEPVALMGIQIQPNVNKTRLTFILSQKTSGKVKYMPNPDRLQVDFANTTKHFNMQNARLGGANVKTMNAEMLENNHLRFTFTLSGSVHWNVTFAPSKNGNNVLMQLDVISDKPAAKPIPSKPQASNFKTKSNIFTVVIDPGHGGKDCGAKGENGATEARVVLAIAKKLAYEINQQPNMRAVLTRNGDYFVPLRKRLKLARKGNADLFVAIHADAYFNAHARGASVYAISQHGASSEAARWLAQRANYSELGGVELNTLKDRSPMLRSVLIDLAQTVTIQDSIKLGVRVLNALNHVSVLHKNNVEQAPFMVLKSPDIPSVLVETGFISNPVEEKKLVDPNYQQQLAKAVCLGINKYISASR